MCVCGYIGVGSPGAASDDGAGTELSPFFFREEAQVSKHDTPPPSPPPSSLSEFLSLDYGCRLLVEVMSVISLTTSLAQVGFCRVMY